MRKSPDWNVRLLSTPLLFAALLFTGCNSHKQDVAPTETVVTDSASSSTDTPTPPSETVASREEPTPQIEEASAPDSGSVAMDACTEETGVPTQAAPPRAMTPLTRRVTDQTGVLTSGCTADLNARISALEKETGAQMAVLLVDTTNGDDIESYANRAFHGSKLGRQGVDDGILLVVALRDKRARIEVGYGLEEKITDAIAGDMLRDDLQPNFRDQHYNAGISAVVNDLAARVRGAALPQPVAKKHNSGGAFLLAMLALSFVLGGVGAFFNLRWPIRLLLPPLLVDLCVLVAVPLHLTTGYRALIAMIPVSMAFSLLGIPFVKNTRASFHWLGSWFGATLLLSILTRGIGHANRMTSQELKPWYLTSVAVGFFLGTLAFIVEKLVRAGGFKGSSGSSGYRDSDSSSSSFSSSSSSSSDSSSSSSSDSGSFSGGGGDSGGGGASSSW